jgi:hypothetical protein
MRLHHPVAWLVVASLAWPAPAAPQAAQPPPPPGPGRDSQAARKGFTGSYEGSAVLTNEDAGSSCRYDGEEGTPSVRLEIGAGSSIAGSIAIDMPAPAGGACPALRKRYSIPELVLSGQALSFTDSGGNEWTLALREQGAVLQGLLAWRQGGVDEPLAEGFTAPGGRRPMSRLSGEVQLRRVVPGSGAGAPAPAESSAGKQAGHVLGIIGANVVGLGLLYAANELGKGGAESGVVTCSPRTCITGAPNEPCFCEGNVLSGAPCGSTPAGSPIGAPCDVRSNTPCQAGLSCNSGICEDRSGRCPY